MYTFGQRDRKVAGGRVENRREFCVDILEWLEFWTRTREIWALQISA